jgi:hypothetical protein
MRMGWLLAAAAAAGAVVAGSHLLGRQPVVSLAVRPAPAATRPPAPPVSGSSTAAPHTAEPTPLATAPPSPTVASAPPAPAPAPAPAPVRPAIRLGAAPLAVEPGTITETIAAGTAFSPLITLTVTATGSAAVTLGRVSTTVPAFHIVRDGCSHARLGPGGGCRVTVQLDGAARGHHSGVLRIPVAGALPASARLDGTVE